MSGIESAALVVVDVQIGFDDATYWGPRNNPECEDNVRRLLDAWRSAGRRVVLVRHDSPDPRSPLRPGQPPRTCTASSPRSSLQQTCCQWRAVDRIPGSSGD